MGEYHKIQFEDEFVFILKYRVIDPADLKSKDGKLVCVVYAFVEEKNTKVKDDAIIMLGVSKQETILECKDWAKKTVEELTKEKWYLLDEHYKTFKEILNDECLAVLDNERKSNA